MIPQPVITEAMEYRPLGRTGLRVSAVGFGTAQLRRVSASQAIDTLLKGFELGVNIVHTAPDYEGADALVAAAVAKASTKIIVASNGYDVQYNRTGRVRLFEKLFEGACRRLKTDRLDLFGIASVEDREGFGENVWGRHGMVEFLQRMKARGRLGATFCTTHGKPEFTRKLIESGAFDAVMLAYNDLGFHTLTLHPPPNWQFEDIRRTKEELFPLCRDRGVGLMVMLPFAGGLLCPSKAFPPADEDKRTLPPVNGGDVLRSILAHEAVSCVMPGTASVAEAEENARAGRVSRDASKPTSFPALEKRLQVLQATLCSRCGVCEPRCSQGLPISWMFRAGYMSLYPSSPYETWEDVEYFRLHPKLAATCATCSEVTCLCPSGLDIPGALASLHHRMIEQMKQGRVPPPPDDRPPAVGDRWFAARVIARELPQAMVAGRTYTCRLFVENRGIRRWHPDGVVHGSTVRLRATLDDMPSTAVVVRQKVIRGGRCHFVFELTAPPSGTHASVRLELIRHHRWRRERRPLVLFQGDIPIQGK